MRIEIECLIYVNQREREREKKREEEGLKLAKGVFWCVCFFPFLKNEMTRLPFVIGDISGEPLLSWDGFAEVGSSSYPNP